jgi:hypothetical protein
MAMKRKATRFLWILSLTLGPVLYFILLFVLPDTPSIEVIRSNLIELVLTIVVYWFLGFGLVWLMYWLGRFLIKYGPFLL